MSAEPPSRRVAVIIPCFNDGRFVTDAVRSAREQEPCEILVVDDGSEDTETERVLRALEEDGVEVIRQENQGVGAARMAGVDSTTAPFIQVLDSDDLLAPGIIAKLADLLDENPEVHAVWGETEAFGERRARYLHWSGFDPWRLTFLNEVPLTMLVRRSALLSVGGWEMAEGLEDWDLALKGAEQRWVGRRVPEVHSLYREHAEPRMFDDVIRNIEQRNAVIRERHPGLFGERRRHRRESSSRRTVKLAWTAIAAIPGTSQATEARLLELARDVLEPEMRASDLPPLRTRIWNKLVRSTGRSAGREPRSRG